MSRQPCIDCGVPTEGTRCAKCAVPLELADSRRPNEKTVAHGVKRAHWQRVRVQRLALVGGYCELNLPGCTKIATSVHLDAGFDGDHDSATIDDARASCAHCHGTLDGPRSHHATAVLA